MSIIETCQYELLKPHVTRQSATVAANQYPAWVIISHWTKWTFQGIENGRPMYRKAGKVSQPKKQ